MHANKSNPELVTELESVGHKLAAVKFLPPTEQADRLFAIFDEDLPDLVKLAADRLAIAPKMSAGAAAVLFERERQQEQERFSPEHDDQHEHGELAEAAACYLVEGENPLPSPPGWPWSPEWWKPGGADLPGRRRRLVKAAALTIAEIDRVDRADAPRKAVEG